MKKLVLVGILSGALAGVGYAQGTGQQAPPTTGQKQTAPAGKKAAGGATRWLDVGNTRDLYLIARAGWMPDSRSVFVLRMNRVQTLESLHRVSLLSSEKTRGVKFHFSSGTLELSAYNPDVGEAKEEFPVEYTSEDLTVGFNARFVLDVLGVLNSENILLEMEDGISPAILRPENDGQHTCVIMPMRV